MLLKKNYLDEQCLVKAAMKNLFYISKINLRGGAATSASSNAVKSTSKCLIDVY